MKRIQLRLAGKKAFAGMRNFLFLWATQALSSLGSAMTGFALIV